MKKYIVIPIVLFFIAFTPVHADTLQEQYVSALRQVIVLLEAQVNILLEQLRAIKQSQVQVQATLPPPDPLAEATTTSNLIPTPIVIVPQISPVVVPQDPTITPVIPLPSHEWLETLAIENVSSYRFVNRTDKQIKFTQVKVKVWQSKMVSDHDYIRVQLVSDVGSDVTNVFNRPLAISETNAEEVTLSVNLVFPPFSDSKFRLEVSSYDVNDPDNRYFIKLNSLDNLQFGSSPVRKTDGSTVYTF